MGRPAFLAAAIGIAAAATAVLLAAAAEQDQQNDDPAQITATETVVTKVTHKDTSNDFFDVAHRHSSHVMIQEEKCASEVLLCSRSVTR